MVIKRPAMPKRMHPLKYIYVIILCKANIRFQLQALCNDKFVKYLAFKMLIKVNLAPLNKKGARMERLLMVCK
jgi:hypothetical protein